MISTKKRYVRTDGWRGYEEPISAIAGANDTGMFSDSPCPSNVCTRELGMVKKELRKLKIRFREVPAQPSNVFCLHRYICVEDKDRELALAVVERLVPETRLLYKVN